MLQVAYAEYELDAIMLTGSCSEMSPGKQLPPPKGLELNLGTEQQPHAVRDPVSALIDAQGCSWQWTRWRDLTGLVL